MTMIRPSLDVIYSICPGLPSAPIQGGGNFGVKSVKLMYFLENLLLYFGARLKKTKFVVMMTKEGSTKSVNFMTQRQGFLC